MSVCLRTLKPVFLPPAATVMTGRFSPHCQGTVGTASPAAPCAAAAVGSPGCPDGHSPAPQARGPALGSPPPSAGAPAPALQSDSPRARNTHPEMSCNKQKVMTKNIWCRHILALFARQLGGSKSLLTRSHCTEHDMTNLQVLVYSSSFSALLVRSSS